MLVKFFGGGGGAETLHADEAAFIADIFFPALANAGFDRNAWCGAENRSAVIFALFVKNPPARHGNHRSADAVFLQLRAGIEGDGNFGTGRQQREIAFAALGLSQYIGARS